MRDKALVGRQKKGQGTFFEEEAANWDDADDSNNNVEMKDDDAKRKRRVTFEENDDMKGVKGGAGQQGGDDDYQEDESADEKDIGEEVEEEEEEEILTEKQRYERESGITLEPFHMREEREEGYVIKKDKNGLCYVEDPKFQMRDAWLEEYDEKWSKDINIKGGTGLGAKNLNKKGKRNNNSSNKKARTEGGKASSSSGRRGGNGDDGDDDDEGIEERIVSADKVLAMKKAVVGLMQSKETITRTLNRIKTEAKEGNDASKMTLFNEVTEMADKLLANGYHNIYSDSKEKMEAALRANQSWEYKVSDDKDAEVYGPFPGSHMVEWLQNGQFATVNALYLRKIGDSNPNFVLIPTEQMEQVLDAI